MIERRCTTCTHVEGLSTEYPCKICLENSAIVYPNWQACFTPDHAKILLSIMYGTIPTKEDMDDARDGLIQYSRLED